MVKYATHFEMNEIPNKSENAWKKTVTVSVVATTKLMNINILKHLFFYTQFIFSLHDQHSLNMLWLIMFS